MGLALITGATSGIGAEYSRLLAGYGWDLIITGRRSELLNENAKQIQKEFNVKVTAIIVDFSDATSFDSFFHNVCNNKILFLVNNVGFSNHTNFFDTPHSGNYKMIDVHVERTTRLIHQIVPGMKKEGRGTIINVSSLAGFLPSLSDPFYAASKSFLSTYSESISMILKPNGIIVQSLCPGFTKTDFHRGRSIKKREKWMSALDVVRYSYKSIGFGRVVIIPGFFNRVVYNIIRFMPKKLYYKIAGGRRVLNEK
ncbi:MAG: SDR family NAD(P)-dependent oxidoreductase [Spirochaetaceae bacterium]